MLAHLSPVLTQMDSQIFIGKEQVLVDSKLLACLAQFISYLLTILSRSHQLTTSTSIQIKDNYHESSSTIHL